VPQLGGRVAVAVSGGRDSMALWHATARAAAAIGGIEVVALHVHHGLLPEAEGWLRRLRQRARRWAARGLPVTLCWRRLEAAPARGESVEAWARRERYAALAEMADQAGAPLVLLAHHRRDQAETVLLQLLRGGGPAGLAAMPAGAERGGRVWARPWLEQPREAIEAYLRYHRLQHVDDPSNQDPRWARNALRLQVWPALTAAFPQAEAVLAASARRMHEAARCLAEVGAADLRRCRAAAGGLLVARWTALEPGRRANALRHWLSAATGAAPDALVRRLLRELPRLRPAQRWPLPGAGGMPGGQLAVHAGVLRVVDAAETAIEGPELTLDLSRCGRHPVPAWGGVFEVRRVSAGGIGVADLRACTLRPRGDRQQFQRAPGTPPRRLKKQYQQAGVPPWQRGGPLVWNAGQLLFVPGLGIDARRLAAGPPMRSLRWLADPEPPRRGEEGGR
jgi:tRNA(Ile)-lysidine synthase